MRLYLINPRNPIVCTVNLKKNRWNKYRVWKPLGLLVLAGLTPHEWEITIIDENLGVTDYKTMPTPDLVGITAFTSQAVRAYEVSSEFRNRGVPVVMGGIHATMCLEEALKRVDSVVTGEAEGIWAQVLEDAKRGDLKRVYTGSQVEMSNIPIARHDLLPNDYFFGSIQTTRGCSLNCSFCSVTAFNGRTYRNRPIENVIQEFKLIKEKFVLIVDDNLIGTRKEHIDRAKELFRAMIHAKLRKKWICQVTINISEDEELLNLAAKAGCVGVFIGFETQSEEGLLEINKNYNIQKSRGDLKPLVKRIQRHGIMVVGAFIMGLDVDKKGIGTQIANAGNRYGVDILNVMFMTPLPGTRLWDKMEGEGRIAANIFPGDWKYYTLSFPVASYKHLSKTDMFNEMTSCLQKFYSYLRILGRVFVNFLRTGKIVNMLIELVSNLSYRHNIRIDLEAYKEFNLSREKKAL